MSKEFVKRIVVPRTKRIYISELKENDVIDIYRILENKKQEEEIEA